MSTWTRSTTVGAVLLIGVLTACSPQPDTTVTSPVPSPLDTPSPTDTRGSDMASTSIRLDLGGTVVEASLNDSPAALALIERLPLTLDFSEYGGQEVLAELSDPLPMDGMPSGESAPAGTIGYYAPDNVLVLYYEDVARFSGIVRLGRFHGDPDLLRDWTASRSVRLEATG